MTRAAALFCVLSALAALWVLGNGASRQEDPAGARFLPPGTRAVAVPAGEQRIWVVTDLRRAGRDWQARRAGATVRLTDEQVRRSGSRLYLLGTDELGRDLLARVASAVRHSALVAAGAVLLALVIGTALGAGAALLGGWVDVLSMRFVDAALAVPRILVYMVCATLARPSLPLLVVVLGATTWPPLARLVRGELLAQVRSEAVDAARATGCTSLRIALHHLIPHAGPLLAVSAALLFADTVLLESAIAFLGLGAPPPVVSLGGLLSAGALYLGRAWWLAAFPIGAIALIVLGARSAATRAVRRGLGPAGQV